MRILVVGAGSIGGYFGGRLLAAKQDVTFLVRPRRAAMLAKTGLIIKSPQGDVAIANPPTVTADQISKSFDLILLSCKAYDLASAVNAFAPAVGPHTAILPLLNGMTHLDVLQNRFGGAAVQGGLCLISTTLDPEGRIIHLNDLHVLTFGERDGVTTPRARAFAAACEGAGLDAKLSPNILQEMWEKWVFIATTAGITCLMRAAVGDIVTAGGTDLALALLDECAAIAAEAGFAPRQDAMQRNRAIFATPSSAMTASMLRDIEAGAPIEADHIIGALLDRAAPQSMARSLLRTAYVHLKAYEARRARNINPGWDNNQRP